VLILFVSASIRLTSYKKLIESMLMRDLECQRLYVPSIIVSWRFSRSLFSNVSQRTAVSNMKFRGRSHPDFIIGKSPRSNYCKPALCVHNERDNYFNYPPRLTTNELHLCGGASDVSFIIAFLSLNDISAFSPLSSSRRSFNIFLRLA